MERRLIHVERDCPALLVPLGAPISIPAGSFVTLTQALGGSYTVVVNGNMARVDGTDAAALGMAPLVFNFPPATDDNVDLDQVHEVLGTIYDPEIPVSILELGLVYDCHVEQVSADPQRSNSPQNKVVIRMTLTAPGCGMGPVLVNDVKYRVAKVPNVHSVDVDLVFDPPWSRDRMSDTARLELGMF